MPKTFIGGDIEFEAEASAAEEVLDRVICNTEEWLSGL